ncbi:MAG: hypothetical protein NZO16_06600 [Deltaproteobacteria bacterium]|nr:hypothetical protein [Deltaproteobacteria bacterium]
MNENIRWQIISLTIAVCIFLTSKLSILIQGSESPRPILLSEDETLNLGDFIYFNKNSLTQIELVPGFGEILVSRLINTQPNNLEQIDTVKGVGRKRMEKLRSFEFLR